ncbi:ribonuclease R family protein [Flectobacillus roseus]|uniref:Ribonuclease R n=1 Tax=Flectobacillus roseus TaxID=502259 RepID=A0ABT6Y9V3_9BACT|nr:RNB domain-containing ribonuclease [Flectobacillus roseus]MDI9860362.1 RNB domain-containing ribonuclease [Flectobacillus roseus]
MTKQKNSKEERFRESVKNEILSFFELNDDRSWSLNQVHKAFAVRDRSTKELFATLVEVLTKDKKLIRQKDGNYIIDRVTEFVTGKVDHVNARFAFVVVEGREDDVWISNQDLNGAIDGDIVKVLISAKRKKGSDRAEGEVVEILEHGRSEIVGTIELLPNYAFVTPDSKRLYQDIFVPREALKDVKHGDKVIVKITKWPLGERKMEGVIQEVLGKAGENNTEMHAILAEFGLPYHFPDGVEQEAEDISEKIPEAEIAKRKDMRGITTFTIDPIDAKDFDDALSFEQLENGNYQIGIHIADVTHYVQPNTILEQEAFKRATSVYLVDRVVPMLPEKLSNGLCSLRPNEDKLTFSAIFEITSKGKIKNEWFGRTVIHSDKRFTYEEAQEVLDLNNPPAEVPATVNETTEVATPVEEVKPKRGRKKKVEEPTTPDVPFLHELTVLNNLAHILRAERFANGAVNFETVEVKFKLDENGKPLGIYQKIRKDAHKLIEEFMLLANKRVAEYVYKLRKKEPRNTMVYRIHEAPDPEKLRTFSTFAKKFGYSVATEAAQISSSFNQLMEGIEGKPEQNILESLAVRTMSKAKYSTDPIGHFGLAFPFYSHFTSPIRRYPDMMAHRMLQHYLDGGDPLERAAWEVRCKHSSEMEKLASEAERASIKYKQVEYMSMMEEERVWDGIISGVTEFGIFVEITETASEGIVRMVDLKDDFYDFDRDNFRIVGQRNGKVYTFGDKVQVRVKECNLARRTMDLLLAGANESRGGGKKDKERFNSRHRSKSDSRGRDNRKKDYKGGKDNKHGSDRKKRK